MTQAVFTGSSVGNHWSHVRFAQNLLNASRERELNEAAQEWRLEKVSTSSEWQHCQLCNRRIRQYVVLANGVNKNRLVIGDDCYGKLLHFLNEHRVESTLSDRGEAAQSLRRYWRGELDKLKDRTVLGWLKDELERNALPAEIKGAVYTVVELGFAPTQADADLVVAYYKSKRRFPLLVFVSWQDLRAFRHRKLLPESITIDQIDRVRLLLARSQELNNRDRQVASRREQQNSWRRVRKTILEGASAHYKRIEMAVHTRILPRHIEVARKELDKVRQAIEVQWPETFFGTEQEMRAKSIGARELLGKVSDDNEWRLAHPELVLFSQSSARGSRGDYVIVHRFGRWEQQWIDEIHTLPELTLATGFYVARVRRTDCYSTVKAIFHKKVELPERLVRVSFTTPSVNASRYFVGTHLGRVVIPSRQITNPGTYIVFLTNDDGRYYRAWVL